MTINDFRTNPLSDKIVNALIEATQAYTKADVLLNEYPAIKPALTDILLTLDTYYNFFDIQPDISQIYHSLYILDQANTATKTISTAAASMRYAQDKVQITGVLTAGDLLKINEAIKVESEEPLTADCCSSEYEHRIKAIWSILHGLYGPQRQYSLLMEISIACYRFLTLSDYDHINLLSQTVLFSTAYQNSLAFQGLYRQWILSTNPQINLASMDIENALIHILYIFQQMWTHTTAIVRKLNDKREEISQFIKASLFRQIPLEFHRLLSENICIRNQDVSEKLHISPKTAIKHLKQFEQEKILYSIKSGRELFYFNNMLIDLIKESLEVQNNGPEKS